MLKRWEKLKNKKIKSNRCVNLCSPTVETVGYVKTVGYF